MGAHFNSNMLIGLIMIVFAIAMYISIVLNRYKTSGFKGKLPVIITSVVIGIIGLVLFVIGIIYEWPNLIVETQQILNYSTSFLI
jgi:uncharacterized membrane protein YhhN